MWFAVKKEHNKNKRENRGRRKVWALGVCEQSGVPVDRQAGGEVCHFIVLGSTDTIWRGLYCLKL